ncbi:helix-turn-helix transcriptional regulator [Dyadobacter psychrophilus]|uniref:DNA-binding transcriptional regulator, XRE-family HTH domain n=1 Tax=Dyadobacter psychrophilus TaxID=651661 RepID=A0A1T5EKW9_9BACT|nr:helix-turn-helix transcriptional regulator [Dyadobacter psychrophilus]SKB84495.1 DNA-binding transcriptional regulator, XRE-family HTH domain [Dyadobacter psychrophilus]
MNLNEKIKQILADKNISPSLFADEIGIQRSSMSHILAGRNKPSLDIVQKIVRRFPELGTNWILDDEDLPDIMPDSFSDNKPGHNPISNGAGSSIALNTKSTGRLEANPGRQASPVHKSGSTLAHNRRIEKILIFYSDGTFEEVKPA